MGVRIKRLKHQYIIIIFSILTTVLLIIGIYEFIKYKQSNPPISTCNNKSIERNENGLLLHWSFDEINNNMVTDLSGNDNAGKIKSAITTDFPHRAIKNYFDINYILGEPVIVKGVKGNAVELNGREFISGGNISAFNTDTFTISLWLWRESIGYEVPTIMAKSSWPWFDGWWLCTKSNKKDIDMAIAWGTSFTHIESGYRLPLKEWHHIAVTMNNKDHEIQFFVDGKPFGKKHENVHEWLVNWNHELFIGDYDGSARWPWDGKLDEVRFYNKVLQKEDIYNIYMEEKSTLLGEL